MNFGIVVIRFVVFVFFIDIMIIFCWIGLTVIELYLMLLILKNLILCIIHFIYEELCYSITALLIYLLISSFISQTLHYLSSTHCWLFQSLKLVLLVFVYTSFIQSLALLHLLSSQNSIKAIIFFYLISSSHLWA